jgi:hypothetical protein
MGRSERNFVSGRRKGIFLSESSKEIPACPSEEYNESKRVAVE